MTRRNLIWIGLLAAVAACGGSGTSYGTPSPQGPQGGTAAQSPTLAVATDARLGGHLVDGNGRSLYYFANDVPGDATHAASSSCGPSCLPIWPIFDADGVDAQGIDAADVARITRADGATQATFRGFPLYYYAGDAAAGDTNGENVNGIWFVVHVPPYSVAQLVKVGESATHLTDGAGHALYEFAQDTVGTATAQPVSACTSAACLSSWMPFTADPVVAPSDLAAADFAAFSRADGSRQTAYRGHPLYRYVGDTAPGETNGRGVPGWQTVDPAAR